MLACLLDCVACLFGWFVRWLLGWLVGFAIACVSVGLFVYTLLTSLLCWLGACFFDVFDGKLARLLGIPTRFGAEFDSFADTISFCAVPSLIIYLVFYV